MWKLQGRYFSMQHLTWLAVRKQLFASRQSPVASRQSPVASLSKDFLAHLICSIAWQITQNETLSALGSEKDALTTATGIQWIQKNVHQPLDFFTSWSCSFRQKNKKNIAEVQFQRALYFLDLLENDNFVLQTKKTKDIQEFAFATGCKNLLGEMQHEKKSPALINHSSLQSAG